MGCIFGTNLLTLLFIWVGLKFKKKFIVSLFYELDFHPVSGGSSKSLIGGIITVIYWQVLFFLIGGVLFRFFFQNNRIEST